MPVDTSKMIMNVEVKDGLDWLWGEVIDEDGNGVAEVVLYWGSLAAAAAAAVGCFPLFLT